MKKMLIQIITIFAITIESCVQKKKVLYREQTLLLLLPIYLYHILPILEYILLTFLCNSR